MQIIIFIYALPLCDNDVVAWNNKRNQSKQTCKCWNSKIKTRSLMEVSRCPHGYGHTLQPISMIFISLKN